MEGKRRAGALVLCLACVLVGPALILGRFMPVEALSFENSIDYAALASSPQSEEWVAQYNGEANSLDYSTAIAVDGAGNVCVTGKSMSLLNNYDFATVKYDSNGDQLWVAYYGGPGNGDDLPAAIAVDSAGNIYVTGQSLGESSNYDYATVKYDRDGNELWVSRYNGAGNGNDVPCAIAVDSGGHVYVTGRSMGPNSYDDYATVKYDESGKQLWVDRYSSSKRGEHSANAITVDSTGNVYVTGNSNDNYVTIKYGTGGNRLWINHYSGNKKGPDSAKAIAVDGAGNVYVTGGSDGDYATLKYNPKGKRMWVRRFKGKKGTNNTARALTLDGAANVYITGDCNGGYVTIKYSARGKRLWVSRVDNLGGKSTPSGIALDGSSNVYVTGVLTPFTELSDYLTVKYDTKKGRQLWSKRYNGPDNNEDFAGAIAMDGAGNVYVTGTSHTSAGNFDYVTVKYSE